MAYGQGESLPSVEDPASKTQRAVADLSDPNFRVRELARWQLSQNPTEALPIIRVALQTAEHHTGAALVDIVTEMALGGESSIQLEAMEVLKQASKRRSSVGGLANNALSAISELQEGQAIELLLHHGAIIGPRAFSLNGKKGLVDSELALHINEDFSGDPAAINRICYLSSVETVCLEGEAIDGTYLNAILEMKGLRNVKLKHVSFPAEDLNVLAELSQIDHIGLIYSQYGDEIVPTLLDLPVSGSIKLYGTKVSKSAGQDLKEELNDLEVFVGGGGFLGVGPMFLSSTRINEVQPNSAAFKAGIRYNDVITHINEVQVKTFDDLRNELGKYSANEGIKITYERFNDTYETTAVLQEEP